MEHLVSVIVPVYNTGERLYPCLDSLLVQTYKNLQILVINDGSTDKITKGICEKYAKKDKRIFFIDKENGGEGSARNRGLEEAEGEYICFVDSDDYVVPEFIESLYKMQKEGAELAICGFLELKNKQIINETKGQIQKMNQAEAMESLLTETSFKGYVWNKMFRTDIIRKYHIMFDVSIDVWEDVLFDFTYLSYIDKITYQPKPLYHYIYWEDSLSHNQNHVLGVEKSFSGVQAQKKMERFIKPEYKGVKRQMGVRYIQNCLGVIRNIGYLKEGKDTPYYKECLAIIRKQKKECASYLPKKDKILTHICGICPDLLLWLYALKS